MTQNVRRPDTLDGTDRRAVLKASGVAGAGLFAGCLDNLGLGDDADDDTITIGSLQPLSGPFTVWGNAHRAGLAFAVDEINDDGGLLDREVEVVEADTESNASEADTLFRRYVEDDGAVAITGPVDSDVGVRTAQTAEDLEVPLVLHMAGSHRIHTKESRYTFRMGSLPAPMDLSPQADLIEENGYEVVGVLNADYEWGNTVAEQVDSFFPEGIDLTMELAAVDESDFAPFLREMDDDTELMVATGHPPGQNSIHSQFLELGYSPEMTTGAGFPPAVIFDELGAEAETFAHLHVVDVYDDAFQDVAERFADDRGERMDTHEALGYVAGTMIAEAVEAADSTDPIDVADEIRDIQFDSLLANPIQYNEWGEIDEVSLLLSTFEPEAPEYFPDGDFRLVEAFRSDPMSADIVEPLVEDER